ncbi:hypothetical protein CMK21_03210 [Candidatus Poribacteria bacterium]|nr:hypothetical protein [Candidatus Poribacteria bacterium]
MVSSQPILILQSITLKVNFLTPRISGFGYSNNRFVPQSIHLKFQMKVPTQYWGSRPAMGHHKNDIKRAKISNIEVYQTNPFIKG